MYGTDWSDTQVSIFVLMFSFYHLFHVCVTLTFFSYGYICYSLIVGVPIGKSLLDLKGEGRCAFHACVKEAHNHS